MSMNAETKSLSVKTTLLMFLSMIFDFLFAWLSGVLMIFAFSPCAGMHNYSDSCGD